MFSGKFLTGGDVPQKVNFLDNIFSSSVKLLYNEQLGDATNTILAGTARVQIDHATGTGWFAGNA
jgi:hypothetical protein